MSSSSTVTYTSVYTNSEPGRVFWGVDEELSDESSPRVIVYGYDGLPMQPVAPPSLYYVPGPKHPPSPDYVPGPEHPPSLVEVPYVPEPEYPEYLVPSDAEAPLEDKPLPTDASPTTLSSVYVADSDPDEDPEEDPEEEHADYPADVGDGDDEPSDDDDDDTDDEDEEPFEDEDDDEEEEHLAPADSSAIPVVDPVPSTRNTEAFETDEATPTPVPSPRRHTTRMSIPSPPLPPPPSSLHLPPPVPTSLPLPSSPLPPLPASLSIPPPVDRREDTPETKLPPRKRLCLTTPTSRNKVGKSLNAAPRPTRGHRADYGFIGTMDAEIRRQRVEEVGYRIRDVWEQDTQDIYAVIEDVQDRQTQLSQRVDVLIEDIQFHHETARLDKQYAAKKNLCYCKGYCCCCKGCCCPMTAAVVEQLIEARVSATLANHETLRNSTNGHGDGSHSFDTRIRGTVHTPRECTHKDFLNCKPFTFKGTEGVVVLSQWFEKMESVFHISNYAVENQVKFATCTFLGNALTWWNSHMKTVTQDVAYAMDWKAIKKMMTVKYCPRGEIKKLEIELWNLKVKGTDIASYTLRFALMCGRMFHEESDKVENYVGGLPDMIQGNVMSYQPKTMENAIEFANNQMDQKVLTIAERQAEQKRKLEFNAGNNHGNQQQNKRQNTRRVYTAGPGVLVPMGHFKKDCPKLKNGNRGNQRGNGNAPAKVYVVGNAGTNPDSNIVTGTFLLNDRYASILFETGADRSFVSTTFSSLIDITPTTLDHYYDVELADGKIIGINTIIRGCTLNFSDHPFNINLMPVELGSFDVIVGMDWLAKYHEVIDYAEKIVRILWGNETLIVHGNGSNRGNGTRLNIISCTKTHKYLLKGHHVSLAHVTMKETEDKSGEKRHEDVPIV
ncbi:putative reverse transcriptase domain-containing protein [Tanacetum coccineum]